MSSSRKSPSLLFARELQEAKPLILLLGEELGTATSAISCYARAVSFAAITESPSAWNRHHCAVSRTLPTRAKSTRCFARQRSY
jgi:hypothetical protein